MNNFKQKGDVLTFAAPYAVASGAGFLVGSIFAVATNAAASGASVEGLTEGVVELTALSTDTTTVGAKVYWDNTNKRITTTSAGNTLVGVAMNAKTSGQLTCLVYLDGSIR